MYNVHVQCRHCRLAKIISCRRRLEHKQTGADALRNHRSAHIAHRLRRLGAKRSTRRRQQRIELRGMAPDGHTSRAPQHNNRAGMGALGERPRASLQDGVKREGGRLLGERDPAQCTCHFRHRARRVSVPLEIVCCLGGDARLRVTYVVDRVRERLFLELSAQQTIYQLIGLTETVLWGSDFSIEVIGLRSCDATLVNRTTVAGVDGFMHSWTTKDRASLSSGPPMNGKKICWPTRSSTS